MTIIRHIGSIVQISVFCFLIIGCSHQPDEFDKTTRDSNTYATPQMESSTITASPTITSSPTITVTPTEVPKFTENEVNSSNPFDAKTFPTRFIKIAELPLNASDQEWLDYHEFLQAVRSNYLVRSGWDDEGGKEPNYNHDLTNLWRMVHWVHLHRTSESYSATVIVLSPLEYRTMLEEPIKIYGDEQKFASDALKYGIIGYQNVGFTRYYYDSVNIGSILGRKDIQTGRATIDGVEGQLSALGSLSLAEPGANIALVDVLSDKGYHVLFPIYISWEKELQVPIGSLCLSTLDDVIDAGPTYSLVKPIDLPPLKLCDMRQCSDADPDTLNTSLGKYISFRTYDLYGGSYFPGYKGIATPSCFSTGLNLEMAGTYMTDADYNIHHSFPWWKLS